MSGAANGWVGTPFDRFPRLGIESFGTDRASVSEAADPLVGLPSWVMRLIALTGGIGSGKSSVSERLAARGAVVIDSDLLVRELQQPGRPVFVAMVARWGERIIAPDGTLDRAAVASIVFGDKAELEAINQIVHPAVKIETRARVATNAQSDRAVILDIPLLVETGNRHGATAVIVIDCPTEVAVQRLIAFRGFSQSDAEARIASQATREARLALADFVIDNGTGLAELDVEVDRCWSWVESLDPTPWPPAP